MKFESSGRKATTLMIRDNIQAGEAAKSLADKYEVTIKPLADCTILSDCFRLSFQMNPWMWIRSRGGHVESLFVPFARYPSFSRESFLSGSLAPKSLLLGSFKFNVLSIPVGPRSSREKNSNVTCGIREVYTGLAGRMAIRRLPCAFPPNLTRNSRIGNSVCHSMTHFLIM